MVLSSKAGTFLYKVRVFLALWKSKLREMMQRNLPQQLPPGTGWALFTKIYDLIASKHIESKITF